MPIDYNVNSNITINMQSILPKNVQATQVYFPYEEYLCFKHMAKLEKKAFTEWIREAAREKAKKKKNKRLKFSEMPTFSWPDVDPYTSQKIDDIVYGSPHGETTI